MFFKKRLFLKKYRFVNKIFFTDLVIFKEKDFLVFKKNDIIYSLFLFNKINIILEKNYLFFFLNSDFKKYNSLIGTYNSIVKNIIYGFSNDFCKKLLLVGVGYKAHVFHNFLYLHLGYSHPVLFKIPKYVSIKSVSASEIHISGFNKQQVFQVASFIRNLKKPDVYKGKGIRYLGENLKIKEIKKK